MNYIQLPNTSAKIILIGDCPRLFIERGLTFGSYSNKVLLMNNQLKPAYVVRPNLKFIYLYRIDMLRINSKLDKSIQQLHILYSNVYFDNKPLKLVNETEKNDLFFEPSNIGANIKQILVIGCIVENIGPYAFKNHERVEKLIFNKTTIRSIELNAFAQSRIDRVELWHSEIINAGDMLMHIDEIRVEQSQLPPNASSYQAQSKTYLTSYKLCMLMSGKNANKKCKKCLKRKCTAILKEEFINNNTSIIKRCARQNLATKDCEFLLFDSYPTLTDIQISLISKAISLYIDSRLIFINFLLNILFLLRNNIFLKKYLTY